MSAQPEALRLAEQLEAIGLHGPVAAELRRLYLVEQALERCKAVCDATSEGWRADAERWQAQRDALLEALRAMRVKYGQYACRVCDLADAAIKAVEEGK